ncbi:MAG: response regulator transcription factor [Massilibacteroides sp.]|nr:response regulator transcription factor [Massilibacteroides sp.]MDD3061361.1 response regulator transcription factor [Massilibacteroides sp.]MDD4116060.1 response regulator transcription factor [Massilibacteroides sp.]MDD4659452.1 response regulator transcription factor [Massilibacteroides sp.]
MAKILLVEDEKNISSFIERGLQEAGHAVITAFDGMSGWTFAQKENFDLLILDIMMPKKNGLELCREYRDFKGYASPVIMLTALGTTEDIVNGLDAGADDYLVKPFSFLELNARINALLRRKGESAETIKSYTCGDLVLDVDAHRAVRKGKTIDLTIREYKLLEYFMTNQGTALSRVDILKYVWEKEAERNTNVVDVYVNYLRTKIDKGHKQKLIQTVVGIGYRMDG